MIKLSEQELIRRAKENYFDTNPAIEKIFVNEYGQFSYRQADLEEPYKHTDVKVFLITRKGLENLQKEQSEKKEIDMYDEAEEKPIGGKGKGKKQ